MNTVPHSGLFGSSLLEGTIFHIFECTFLLHWSIHLSTSRCNSPNDILKSKPGEQFTNDHLQLKCRCILYNLKRTNETYPFNTSLAKKKQILTLHGIESVYKRWANILATFLNLFVSSRWMVSYCSLKMTSKDSMYSFFNKQKRYKRKSCRHYMVNTYQWKA